MKILVISDSHGNIVRLKHVLGFGESIGAGAVIHCGDWDNPEAVKTFGNTKIPVFGVLGNADINPAIPDALKALRITFDPVFLEVKFANKTFGITHSPATLKGPIKDQKYDALFYGHLHSPQKQFKGKTLVVRPGALGKTNQPSFAIYDTGLNDVEFVSVEV